MDFIYDVDGAVATPTAHASGPWDPSMQHGSPPSALIVRTAEALPAKAPMRIARVTVDLLRPVPLSPLTIVAEIVREGRRIQVIAVSLRAGETEVVRASVLRVRREAVALPAEAAAPAMTMPLPENGLDQHIGGRGRGGFASGLEMRVVRGAFDEPGPAAVWYHFKRPFVRGEVASPAMIATATGDFCNGSSSAVPFEEYTFINADLSVSLAREPIGDWILLDSESWYGDEGRAIAFAGLADRHGYFGRAIQSIILERR